MNDINRKYRKLSRIMRHITEISMEQLGSQIKKKANAPAVKIGEEMQQNYFKNFFAVGEDKLFPVGGPVNEPLKELV